MLDRLDAGIERERRFVADASHELRTPLALLRAELEVALRRPREAEELRAALAAAAADTDRLVRLANDLLVLATAGGGELPLSREPVPARVSSTRSRRGSRRSRLRRAGDWRSRPRTASSSTPTGCGSSRRSATSSTTRSGTGKGRCG